MRIGTVLGIDARGRTSPGALRVVGNVVELSLPASFVDSAELPLILDPLVGYILPSLARRFAPRPKPNATTGNERIPALAAISG